MGIVELSASDWLAVVRLLTEFVLVPIALFLWGIYNKLARLTEKVTLLEHDVERLKLNGSQPPKRHHTVHRSGEARGKGRQI